MDNEREEDEDDISDIQNPMTALKIDSKDPLELTLTKTSLGILQNLGQVSLFQHCVFITFQLLPALMLLLLLLSYLTAYFASSSVQLGTQI